MSKNKKYKNRRELFEKNSKKSKKSSESIKHLDKYLDDTSCQDTAEDFEDYDTNKKYDDYNDYENSVTIVELTNAADAEDSIVAESSADADVAAVADVADDAEAPANLLKPEASQDITQFAITVEPDDEDWEEAETLPRTNPLSPPIRFEDELSYVLAQKSPSSSRSMLRDNNISDFGGSLYGDSEYGGNDFWDNSWMMKALFNELLNRFTFMSLDDQLYVYDDASGYFRHLPCDSQFRSLRRLLGIEKLGKVCGKDLKELYEWLVIHANRVRDYQLPNSTNYINFADCAYNVMTGASMRERRDLHFRYALSIRRSEKNKSSGTFAEFVKQIFKKDHDTYVEFRKFMGLALSNIRDLKFAFMFYGSGTGKTTLLNLLNLLFDPNCSIALSFHQLTNDSTVTELIGKHICTSSSTAGMSGRDSKHMGTFKALVGNDIMSVKQRSGTYTPFRNRSLLVFSSESLPEIKNISEVAGFAAQIIIFPFQNVLPRDEWKLNQAQNLLSDSAGIAEFAINGLKDLIESKFTFTLSKAMLAAKEEFQGNLESFTIFADKYLKASGSGKLTSSEIEYYYTLFCTLKDFPCLHSNQWSTILTKKFTCRKTMFSCAGERIRGYVGIEFRKTIYELEGEYTAEYTEEDASDEEIEEISELSITDIWDVEYEGNCDEE